MHFNINYTIRGIKLPLFIFFISLFILLLWTLHKLFINSIITDLSICVMTETPFYDNSKWSFRIIGIGNDRIFDMKTDLNNNIYLLCEVNNALNTLDYGENGVYLVKIINGNLIWKKKLKKNLIGVFDKYKNKIYITNTLVYVIIDHKIFALEHNGEIIYENTFNKKGIIIKNNIIYAEKNTLLKRTISGSENIWECNGIYNDNINYIVGENDILYVIGDAIMKINIFNGDVEIVKNNELDIILGGEIDHEGNVILFGQKKNDELKYCLEKLFINGETIEEININYIIRDIALIADEIVIVGIIIGKGRIRENLMMKDKSTAYATIIGVVNNKMKYRELLIQENFDIFDIDIVNDDEIILAGICRGDIFIVNIGNCCNFDKK